MEEIFKMVVAHLNVEVPKGAPPQWWDQFRWEASFWQTRLSQNIIKNIKAKSKLIPRLLNSIVEDHIFPKIFAFVKDQNATMEEKLKTFTFSFMVSKDWHTSAKATLGYAALCLESVDKLVEDHQIPYNDCCIDGQRPYCRACLADDKDSKRNWEALLEGITALPTMVAMDQEEGKMVQDFCHNVNYCSRWNIVKM